MRNEPCRQCGMFDFYTKGDFSYCRPCHAEAQRRYASKLSEKKELLKPPAYSLDELMSLPESFNRKKTHCVNGHPLSGSNVRVSSQRSNKVVARRRCRACERNAKRVTYGLQPEPAPKTLGQMLDNHNDSG